MTQTKPHRFEVQDRTSFEKFFVFSASLFVLGVALYLSAMGVLARVGDDDDNDGEDDDQKDPRDEIAGRLARGLLSFILMATGLAGWIVTERISRPPENSVDMYLSGSMGLPASTTSSTLEGESVEGKRESEREATSVLRPGKVLVCAGDSITQGRVSADFVSALTEGDLCRDGGVTVVNAGQNSICSHTVLHHRVSGIAACRPDFVVLMIGTNDAFGIYSQLRARDLKRTWQLPEEPNLAAYERNLRGILNALVLNTDADIAVCTLPPLGENLKSRSNDVVRTVNAIITKIVEESSRKGSDGRLALLDGYSKMKEDIERNTPASESLSVDNFYSQVIWMNFYYHIFGVSWNDMSHKVGNVVLSDSLHLNERGADVMVAIISKWLSKKLK